MICIREADDLNIKWWCIKYFSCKLLVQSTFSCAEFPAYCLFLFGCLTYAVLTVLKHPVFCAFGGEMCMESNAAKFL